MKQNRQTSIFTFGFLIILTLLLLFRGVQLQAQCTGLGSITLNIVAAPTPTLNFTPQICAGQSTTIAVNQIFSSYAWSGGLGSGQSVSVNTAGTYTVTVSNTAGCTATATATIALVPAPTATITQTPNCLGTVVLNAGSGFSTYAWSDGGGGGATATYPAAGTYTVTVSNATGCTGTATFTGTVPTPPTVAITGTLSLCSGQNTTLNATAGFTSYSWTGGSTSPNLTVTNAGTYAVTATNAQGCTTATSVLVSSQTSPVPSVTSGAACQGVPVTLNISNTPFVSYDWSNSGGNGSSANYSAAGTYTVTVTAANGCTGTGSGVVTINTLPAPNIVQNPYACNGQIVLNAGGGFSSYAWSNGGGSNPTATFSLSGTYTVTVTNAVGCTNTDDFLVNIPSAPVVDISGTLSFCTSSSTTLNATAGFASYSWTGGSTSPNLTVTNAGTYTVTATNAQGCTTATSVLVSSQASPVPTVTSGAACQGFPVNLNISNAPFASYDWSGGGGNGSSASYSTAGTYTVTVTAANGCTGTGSGVVTINALPTPSIIQNTYACNGQIVLNAGGGFSSYAWSNGGGSGSSATYSSSGTYTVTVTNAAGCTNTDDFVVNIPSPPVVNISGALSFCASSFTTLSATPGFVGYNWTGGSSNVNLTVNSSGTYTVTATDAFGCTDTETASVVVLATPNPDITGSASVCAGNNVTLSVLNGPYTAYNWSTSSTNPTISVTNSGNYTVTVTASNGCTATAVETQTFLLAPTPSINVATSCNNQSTLSTSTPYSAYAWSNSAITPTTVVTVENNYTVTVTNGQGCTASTSIFADILPIPVVSISGATSFCSGSSTTLSATAGFVSYIWSNTQSTPSININTSGTYGVTVTNADGCTDEATFSVSQLPVPNPIITGPSSICAGGSATFSVAAGFTGYIWSNSQVGASITTGTPGNYTVTVTAANGCTGTDDISLVISNSLNINIVAQAYQCNGTLTLDAGSGFSTYNWSTAGNGSTIVVNAAGNYTVTVTDITGCTGSDTFTAAIPAAPNVAISGPSTICAGSQALLEATTGFNQYVWSTTGLNSSIQVSTAGDYTVTVTDNNGCTATSSTTLAISSAPSPTITGSTNICSGNTANFALSQTYASYLWSNAASTPTINVGTAGTYTVTVTNVAGCTGTDTQILTVSTSLSPNVTFDPYQCNGQVTLTASPGYQTYSWSTSSNTPTTSITSSGNYTVTVTDLSGCTGIVTTFALVPIQISVAVTGTNTLCNGESTTLNATTGYSNYLWSNTGTGAAINITPTTSTNYVVTATDANNCTSTASIIVAVNALPVPAIVGGTTICNGSNTTLNVNQSFAQYLWSSSETINSISTNVAGTYTVTVTDANNCTGTATTTLSVATSLAPSIAIQPYTCNGTLTLSTGIGFNTYLWDNSATTSSIIVSQSGVYTVSVTDLSGCSGTATITATIPTQPVVSITGDASVCAGASATLNATAGFINYAWSNADTSPSITVSPLTATIYTVTITDANNCTVTASTTIGVNANPSPTLTGATTICNNNNVTIGVFTNFSQYQWSNAEITNTISTNLAGIYTVTVTDNVGCKGTASVTLVAGNTIVPVLAIAPYTCNGTLTLTADSGFNTYLWSNSNTTSNTTVNQSGIYTVTVTDTNGCSGTATITANVPTLPTVSITGNTAVCAGNSVNLAASGGFVSYDWSNSSNLQNITITPILSNTYTVTATDQNGCTATNTATVVVNSLPTPTINGSTTICNGAATSIAVTTPYNSYIWSGSQTSSSISVNTAGIYTVTVTDINTCTGTATITLVNGTNLTPVISANPYQCDNTITLNVGTGFTTYTWNTAANTNTITITQSGNYTVTVSNASGCTGSAVFNAIIPIQNTVTITGPSSICSGNTATLTANAGFVDYKWSNTTLGNSIIVTPPNAQTTYTVTATDANGCTSTDEITIAVNSALTIQISGNKVICNGSSTTLTADLGYASYIWSNGLTTPVLTTNIADTYTVTVTDISGCTGTASLTTEAQIAPDPMINEDPYECNNQLVLNVQQGYVNYEWSIGGGTTSITVSQDGEYSITVTDINGCTGTNSFFANIPDALLVIIQTPSTPICEGGSASLSVPPGLAGYNWSSGQQVNAITVTQPGNYTVTATDVFGCTATDDFSFVFSPKPTVSISGNSILCDGGSATLTAAGSAGTFQWSNNTTGSTLIVSPSIPTVYTVTITDANNCTATATQLVEAAEEIVIDWVGTDPSCTVGGVLTLQGISGGQSPFEVSISNGVGSFETDGVLLPSEYIKYNNIKDGDYTLTVIDALGCTAEADLTLTTPAFTEFFADTIEFIRGQQIPLTPPITIASVDIQWTNASILSCANCLIPIASPIDNTLVEYSVQGQGPCQSTGFYYLITAQKDASIYVPNTIALDDDRNFGFTIYGDINLLRIKSLQVYDRWGGKMAVYSNILPNDPSSGWDGRYRNKFVEPGVYVFWAEVELADGSTRTLSGDITVVK
jgi:hypothetical protein